MARRSRRRSSKPELGEITEALVESIDQEGRGVAHVEGKAIFIDGALPGEKVTYQSHRIKESFEVAKVVEILTKSDLRVEPKCVHFGLCGGCKLQHLDGDAQVAAKQKLLEDDFKHIGKVTPLEMMEPLNGPSFGYRHKARMSAKFVHKKERALVGFNEKGTRFVADMNSCEVLVPEVSALIEPLQLMIAKLSIREKLPQIELAVGEPHGDSDHPVIVLIIRIMEALSDEDEVIFKAFADEHNIQIWTQTKGPDTIKPFWPLEGDQLQYSLPEFDLVYPFKPNEFTQVNPEINRMMISRAMALLSPQAGEEVADFFCGIGNFTLPIAKSGANVLGLEGLSNLVDRANEGAALNGVTNATFGVSDLFTMTEESLTALGKKDKWLVDPSRDGAYELVQAINSDNAPKVIVYVSCNPATLARDAGVLVNEKGYQLSKAGVINMFPHTAHIESIALFELK
jgi:23S rRNA (uracil1939-C5)-methyltransferase